MYPVIRYIYKIFRLLQTTRSYQIPCGQPKSTRQDVVLVITTSSNVWFPRTFFLTIPVLGPIYGVRSQIYLHQRPIVDMKKQILGAIFAVAVAALMVWLSPTLAFAANSPEQVIFSGAATEPLIGRISKEEPNHSQEQIVFSGAVAGTFGGEEGKAAFWIWCKNSEGPNSHSYEMDCQGAMQFPALGITKGVTQEEGITEPSEGAYVIHVQSRNDGGQSVDCTLSNVPPITGGPTNTVNVHCISAPTSGDGATNTAVIVATGPD